jgi:predicted regulator of amino acid metabolism with ACT domain
MKLLCALLVSCLCGCATPLMLTGVGIGSVAVSEATGKSVTDHAVSTVNNKDCRVSRAFADKPVCQESGPVKIHTVTTGVVPSTPQEIESRYR